MSICFLTPSNRTDFIPPPLIRIIKKQSDFDGRFHITQKEFFSLPAKEKAGFLFMHEKGYYVRKWSPNELRRETALRLVEAPKSPTPDFELEKAFSKHRFDFDFLKNTHSALLHEVQPEQEIKLRPVVTPHNAPSTSTVIQFREWSDEWRIRTQVQGANLKPPSNEGERFTEILSERGAKKIAEACEYMSLKKGGFKTFVTGTFNEETRQKIKLGETSIQREVSRCMDSLQKMYQRGWVTDSGEKIEGSKDGLAYVWVVEIPLNENGEENPHVHMLLNWSVPFRNFSCWSKRIERIWGNGYFHLEKIKNCACAGAYMAKAAGYMTKGKGDESQGKVKGNRYGISESARAPSWVTIGQSQLHTMGQLIADVYDHLTVKYGELYRNRKKLREKLDLIPKAAKWTRQQVGKALEQVRAEIKKIPIRCNKYQVILKGYATASAFMMWAKGEAFPRPEWLPQLSKELVWQEGRKPEAKDSLYFTKIREAFRVRKILRQSFYFEKFAEVSAYLVNQWEVLKNEILNSEAEYERAFYA